MRDLFKKILFGIALIFIPSVLAEDYKVLVITDNVVTDNVAVDAFIYNASAEFFADDIVNLLNKTDHITAPSVSETRELYKQDPSAMIMAKNLTNKFRTSYNVDYSTLKKLSNKSNSKYALLMTSHIDAENYILRRTIWDFLNIPGASVIDPAYKISTYAVLIDTEKNLKLWSDTYYKTISVCENRIISRGASPQTEQLQKIKDYSRYISPQIAQNVQRNVLPPEVLSTESARIDYGIGNIDNVFTKKSRHIGRELKKMKPKSKKTSEDLIEDKKLSRKEKKALKKQEKLQKELDSQLEVKATPVYENNINNTESEKKSNTVDAIYKKNNGDIQYSGLIDIEIKKKKKNNLYNDFELTQPKLRNYNSL